MVGQSMRMIVAVAAMSLGTVANAATYYLNYANEFSIVQTYAKVDVDLLGSGNVQFKVTLAPFLVALNQGMSEFGFNVTAGTPELTSANIVNSTAPASWAFAGESAEQKKTMDGMGKYNYTYGDANDRATSPLTFEIAATGDAAANYVSLAKGGENCGPNDCYFALHIVNLEGFPAYLGKTFYVSGGPDDEFVPPVPLPAAGWLLGSALLGLVGIGRRRRSVA